MLAVRGVSASHGPRAVLIDVDLDAPEAQVLAVVGPSGSGKSTLLRVIAGLHRPDAGQVLLDGTDVTTLAPERRAVGLMFQQHALFPHRDVAGNVGFGPRMQGLAPAAVAGRVAEALELVGLTGAQDRDVTTLSGGEQQRVALARAIAARPRLLLLDEPLGSLDRVLRTDLLASLPRLFARLGTTVVTVTHDQEEALALADRIAVLDQGRVLQSGAPEEVWERPASVEVARFLGLGPVLRAHVRGRTASTPLGDLAAGGVADGETDVVLLPGALVARVDGPLVGRVVSRRFAGDSTTLRVAVGTMEVQLAVAVDDPARQGDTLRLAFDPTRLRWLASARGSHRDRADEGQ